MAIVGQPTARHQRASEMNGSLTNDNLALATEYLQVRRNMRFQLAGLQTLTPCISCASRVVLRARV
ncbi:MAG: hypothetical protein ACOC7K_00095 [bacterium]